MIMIVFLQVTNAFFATTKSEYENIHVKISIFIRFWQMDELEASNPLYFLVVGKFAALYWSQVFKNYIELTLIVIWDGEKH